MSAMTKIETKCPECSARYHVPASAAGHHARCSKCRTKFLVEPVRRKLTPTEEDVLRWLNEERDDGEVTASPRVISGGPRREKYEEAAEPQTSSTGAKPHSVPAGPTRLAPHDPDLAPHEMLLRKTG
jgi:predicted Zn finger-like uncharacterized protein